MYRFVFQLIVSIAVCSNTVCAETQSKEASLGADRSLNINGCRAIGLASESLSRADATWTGQCVDGKLHGEGELKFQWVGSGLPLIFKGHFAGGQLERGRMDNSGTIYEGEFENISPHGEGEMTFHNGTKIKGRFAAGRVAGEGVYELTTSSMRYVGALDSLARMHGRGVLTYADGMVYEGEFFEHHLQGIGVLKRADGAVEEGRFANDFLNGAGKKTWANGTRYEGQFRAGHAQGQGIMRSADGSEYVGQFLSDRYSGRGKLTDVSGKVCEGDFIAGQLHGKAKCLWANGDQYDGGFIADKRAGDGLYIEADGEVKEGQFLNGELNGRCRISRPNGYLFEGQCVAGKANGTGRLKDPVEEMTYEGTFRNGMMDGEGTLTEGRSTYVGTFKEGLREGHGREITREEGAEISYEGDYSDDARNGHGVMSARAANGSLVTYEGHYVDGRMEGEGVLHVDGRKMSGLFKAGVLVRGTINTQDGRKFEVDEASRSIKEVMKDGSKRDLDTFPADLKNDA